MILLLNDDKRYQKKEDNHRDTESTEFPVSSVALWFLKSFFVPPP